MHDTDWGTPFTRERQFALDWANYCRWAVGPLKDRASFRAEWELLHDDCADCVATS